MQKSGRQSQGLYVAETTWNTTPGSPAGIVIPYVSESVRYAKAREADPTITSAPEYRRPVAGNIEVSGDITVHLDGMAHGYLLKELLGAPTTVDNLDGTYTHTFKASGQRPVGFEFEREIDGEFYLYTGLRMARATLELAGTGFLRAVFSVLGAGEAVGTSSVDPSPTNHGHRAFDLGASGAVIKEGGVAIATLVEASITVDNESEAAPPALGAGGVPSGVSHGMCRITGRIRGIYESRTLYEKAKNDTESSLEFTYQLGTGDGTVGNEKLVIRVPELLYHPSATTVDTPKGLYAEQEFTAFYDDNADGTSLVVELTNTISGY